jgi:hypothetical protein
MSKDKKMSNSLMPSATYHGVPGPALLELGFEGLHLRGGEAAEEAYCVELRL